jgi:hypothetical protein
MARKPNANWASGRAALPPPASETEFEARLRKLKLTYGTCVDSPQLRRWCEENRNRCYVPEWLLKAWGIDVDSNVS